MAPGRPNSTDQSNIADTLRAWAIDAALPLWATTGFDQRRGGFHERLTLAGVPDLGCPRRTRVQARQIYVYAHAAVLGWHSDAAAVALGGLEFMLRHCRSPDGAPGYVMLLTPDNAIADPLRDTYDLAFVILALAWVARATGDAQVFALVDEALAFLDEHLASDAGGFHESLPPKLPRRQNPHMHLFEAMLALHENIQHPQALPRARSLLALFESTLVDRETGTIREYFDARWRPAAGEGGDLVEPGHHAEWTWLLRKFERMTGEASRIAPTDLIDSAVRFTDQRSGMLIDEADRLGHVRKATRRCWPQTELAKAWLAEHEAGRGGAVEKAAAALRALAKDYLAGPVPGAWFDSFDAEGQADATHVPASTFYHLFCAIAEADRLLGTPQA